MTRVAPSSGTPQAFIRELSDRYGLAHAEFAALSRNHDPWLTGTHTDVERGEWFASIYEALGRPRVHLRDLHYMLVARMVPRHDGELYAGTDKDWLLFCEAASKARELGLVSPFSLVDRRTRAEHPFDEHPPVGYQVEPGSAYLKLPSVDPGWSETWPPKLTAPTVLSRQPLVAEVWVEKESAALEREVLPVAQRFGARVVVGQGFQSETAAANLVRRAVDDGRGRVVFWLADADAAGESMALATARHAEFLCRHWLAAHEPETIVPRILFDRAALTLEQIGAIEAEIGRTIPVSPDVAREEGRVELQALAAFAPGWLGGELTRRLQEVADPGLHQALDEWAADAEHDLEEAWEAATEALRDRLGSLEQKRGEILSRFDLAGLEAALAELEPERERLEADYDALAARLELDLPEPPDGAVDLGRRDWLMDTERGYLEQLDAYRRHEPVHRRRPPLTLAERACQQCGGSLQGRKTNAKFCSQDCRWRNRDARARAGPRQAPSGSRDS